MFGDYDEDVQIAKEKKIKVFMNGNPLANPITVKITKSARFKDILRQLDEKYPNYYKQLRLFNQEGVELNQDDLEYIKNGVNLFASAGEEFDSNSTFSEYEMVKELGQGGFGKVLLGIHRTTKEKVAIKIVKTSLIGNAQDIDMVFREAEIMKSLNHKNIVKISNCFTLTGMQVVFVMEYLEGGELLQRLEKKGKFTEEEAKNYFKQIVDAMAYCHRNKLIHRDLKLENILLTTSESNEIKIIDFGIAGSTANINIDNLDAGSLRYMSPEVLSQKITKLTSAIDVWSMGVILYSMLMGELPFYAESNSISKDLICEGNYIIPPSISKTLSPECKNVLKQTLDVNPATRISTVDLLNHPWISEKKLYEHLEESKQSNSKIPEIDDNDKSDKNEKYNNINRLSPTKNSVLNPTAAQKTAAKINITSTSMSSKTTFANKQYGSNTPTALSNPKTTHIRSQSKNNSPAPRIIGSTQTTINSKSTFQKPSIPTKK